MFEQITDDGFVLNVIVYWGKGTFVSEESSHAENVVDYLENAHLDNFTLVFL